MSDRAIPNPAFWAITEKDGAQLIDPVSELHQTIIDRLDVIPTHGVVGVGDILVASEVSAVIAPEDLGVDRETISGYQTKPEQVVQGGLRKLFHKGR